MSSNTLAEICELVESEPEKTRSPQSAWERLLSWLFPPAPLHKIGQVDESSMGYAYRLSRTEGYERNIAEINMAVKIGRVIEGQAKPMPKPGTREARAAWSERETG